MILLNTIVSSIYQNTPQELQFHFKVKMWVLADISLNYHINGILKGKKTSISDIENPHIKLKL